MYILSYIIYLLESNQNESNILYLKSRLKVVFKARKIIVKLNFELISVDNIWPVVKCTCRCRSCRAGHVLQKVHAQSWLMHSLPRPSCTSGGSRHKHRDFRHRVREDESALHIYSSEIPSLKAHCWLVSSIHRLIQHDPVSLRAACQASLLCLTHCSKNPDFASNSPLAPPAASAETHWLSRFHSASAKIHWSPFNFNSQRHCLNFWEETWCQNLQGARPAKLLSFLLFSHVQHISTFSLRHLSCLTKSCRLGSAGSRPSCLLRHCAGWTKWCFLIKGATSQSPWPAQPPHEKHKNTLDQLWISEFWVWHSCAFIHSSISPSPRPPNSTSKWSMVGISLLKSDIYMYNYMNLHFTYLFWGQAPRAFGMSAAAIDQASARLANRLKQEISKISVPLLKKSQKREATRWVWILHSTKTAYQLPSVVMGALLDYADYAWKDSMIEIERSSK